MRLNCSINFHLGFYKTSVLTDNVDQDQTAQTVQSDVGFIISVNLWDTFLSKKKKKIIIITLKWHYQGFNHVL